MQPIISFPSVREIVATTALGIKTDSTTTGGDVNLYAGKDAPTQNFTHNLGAGLVIGLNILGAKPGDKFRIARNSGTPAAQTVIVKSGTAAAGTALGTLAASTNGHFEAQFDGAAWVRIAQGVNP